MSLTSIPRAALDRSLKLIRTPVDVALSRATGNRSSAVKVAVDRADATVRGVAGTALRDETLKGDAQRRHAAADERQRATELRGRAGTVREEADARAAEREAEAERRRRDAAQKAERRRKAAQKRRDTAKSKATKEAQQRKQQAKKEAEKTEEQAGKRAKKERLEQLEGKEAALNEKEAALTEAAEAERLKEAAAKAKAKRKSG